MEKSFKSKYGIGFFFYVLLLICIGIRIIMLVSYTPLSVEDTPGYTSLAQNIQTLNFSTYLGQRTPGYPIIILIANFNTYGIMIIQSILGIVTSLMFFMIAFSHTQNEKISFVIGLAHSSVLNILFLEMLILTEVLSIFLLVLSLLLFTHITQNTTPIDKRNIWYYIALGLVVAWAALTRPILALLAPIYFLFLIFHLWRTHTIPILRRIKWVASYIVLPFLFVFGWGFFNYTTLDYFGITTLTGINLIHHSIPYSYLASDEFSELKDVIHEQRTINLEEKGQCDVSIWEVRSKMKEVTGLSSIELSQELTNMTKDIFSKRPLFYVESFWESWMRFWIGPNILHRDKIEMSFVTNFVYTIWIFERPLVFFSNILFLNIALYYVHQAVISRDITRLTEFQFLLVMIVVSASIVQAMMENADNMRFALPYQSLMMYVSVVSVWKFFSELIQNRKSLPDKTLS